MGTAIKIESLYKEYRLGVIGHGTLYRDLQTWWARMRGREDPNSLLGSRQGGSSKTNLLALDHIDLEIADGEVLGIVGANGAGKSTLLKILSRVTAPTRGLIRVKGRIASLLEVGTGFHNELTGRENIYLNGAINGMSRREVTSKLDEIVAFAGVEQFLDTPVKRYSSGMHVRLGFAVAAHLDPDILVVDEVLAVGDAEFQRKAIGKMQEVSKAQNRTVLFVSHNMEAVKRMCTRAILLEHGKLVHDATPAETIDRYLQISKDRADSPLATRTDRTGDGRVRITGIECFDKKGRQVEEPVSGEYLRMEISYELTGQVDPDVLYVGVYFKDMRGNPVTGLCSDEMGAKFSEINPHGRLVATVPRLMLRAGKWMITVCIAEYGSRIKGGRKPVFVDSIDGAMVLSVQPGDFWKTGKNHRDAVYGDMDMTEGKVLLVGELYNENGS